MLDTPDTTPTPADMAAHPAGTANTPKHAGEAAKPEALLGVKHSLSGQLWARRPFLARHAEAMAMREQLPLVVGEVLASRGVTPETCHAFLNPSLRDDMPNPSILKDMDKAATRTADAILGGETIGIFGDYDVDGATSSALLIRYFEAVGAKSLFHIPDRMVEGYGPNAPALLGLGERGCSLIITVDCGTLSFEPFEAAANAGLDIIVLDHHKAETALPKVHSLVNPNRIDDDSGLGHLAAVGVTFLFLVALSRCLRERGAFAQGLREPNLLQYLDMVALGTVCDVVPLVGLNRTYVERGLEVMAHRDNIGLRALADVGRLDEKPQAYHLGFVLGPRVNAGGRVGRSDLGTRLLTTQDTKAAQAMAEELDAYNSERRTIEKMVLDAALDDAERQRLALEKRGQSLSVLVVAGRDWHAGVIGIVASRLKEKYGVPSLVIGVEMTGEGKGSGRSISGVDMGAAVIEAVHQGLLVKGGGHAMAAGLTVTEDKIDAFRDFLIQHMAASVAKAQENNCCYIDGLIAPGGATAELIDALERVGPYGVGNPGPRFAIEACTLVDCARIGEDHVRCRFKGRDGKSLKVMAFRSADTDMGMALLRGVGQKFHIVGKLKKDEWRGGGAVEMTLEDAAPFA